MMLLNEMIQTNGCPQPGIPYEPLVDILDKDNIFMQNIDSFIEALSYAINKLTKHKTKLHGTTHFNLNVSIDNNATISFFKDNGESLNGLLSAMHETKMLYLSIIYAVIKIGGEKYRKIFAVDEDFFIDIEYSLHDSTKEFINEINTMSCDLQ